MNNQEIEIINIVKDIMKIRELSIDDSLHNLGVSSIKMMLILSSIENNFDIDIDVDKMIPEKLQTVSLLSKLVDDARIRK